MVGQFDAARWQKMYAQLLDLHVLKKPIEVNSAFTTSYLRIGGRRLSKSSSLEWNHEGTSNKNAYDNSSAGA